ncbi:MAG: DUF1080 domain-containing protein [Planctomycetes bacterium]|nr:DUF1080 domain-containing protein [Planctomycetota bacterium]
MTRSTATFPGVFIALLAVLPAFAFTVAPARGQADAKRTAADEEGFEPLCNGKDLSGWVKEGKAGFEVRDGMIVCNGSGNWPTWLRSEEVFENFILRLEYKTFYGAETGVFFHAPLHGRVSEVGYELQIGGFGQLGRYSTGAISGAAAPLVMAARHYADKEYDELEIAMNWPRLKVKLNGQLVQDLDCSEHELLCRKPRLGYLGFQDCGKPVHFRNVRVKRLPDQVRDQWKPMLDGKSLDGWTVSEKCSATWKIDDEGALVSENGHGYLISDEPFRNCEFQTYIQTSHLANGGIFFGWQTGKGRGFEVQIEDVPDSNDPTGSIYGRVRAKVLPHQQGDWVLMQVLLNEEHCAVRVDGVIVAESHEMGGRRLGNISLQMHRGDSFIRWKEMRVRHLPSPETEAE